MMGATHPTEHRQAVSQFNKRGYAERLLHMIYALAAARRAQKLPRAASVRIVRYAPWTSGGQHPSLSSVRSDTVRRNLWFLVSSSFSRLSWSLFMPPYFLRQR